MAEPLLRVVIVDVAGAGYSADLDNIEAVRALRHGLIAGATHAARVGHDDAAVALDGVVGWINGLPRRVKAGQDVSRVLQPVDVGGSVPGVDPSARLLTLDETAKAMRVSLSTVRRLVQRGEVASTLVGRSRRIDADSVARYLAKP